MVAITIGICAFVVALCAFLCELRTLNRDSQITKLMYINNDLVTDYEQLRKGSKELLSEYDYIWNVLSEKLTDEELSDLICEINKLRSEN